MTDTITRSYQTIDFVKNEATHNDRLPSLGQCVEIIKRLGESSRTTPVHEISGVILKDLTLTTRVLQIANSIKYNRSGQRISTVTQAILILGLAPIRSIAVSILLLEKLANHLHADSIRQACILSVLGGTIARGMAEKSNFDEPEQAFIDAAFGHFGLLLAHAFLEDSARAAEEMIKKEEATFDEAYTQTIGLRPEQLGKEIAEFLHLPASITSYMDPEHPSERDLAEINPKLLEIVRFSHKICHSLSMTKTVEEMEAMLKSVKTPDKCTFDVVEGVKQAIQEIQGFYHYDTNQDFWRRATKFATVPAKEEHVAKKDPELPILDLIQFQEAVANITGLMIEPDVTMEHILSAIAETMYICFKARNVVVGLRSSANVSMLPRAIYGADTEFLRTQTLVKSTDDSQSITAVSLHSSRDLYISNPRDPRIADHMPEWIQSLRPSSFLILPITPDSQPLGLFFIDSPNVTWKGTIPEDVQRELKILRHAAILALKLEKLR
jgi:HD-like signal output (HDOD) protein